MSNYSKNLVYLSDAQYQALVTDGSIIVDNTTITYDENDIYVTPQAEPYIKPSNGIPASDLASNVIPSVPVQDVQINGTSILSQSVANVPVADSNNYGVVKVDYGWGITKVENGALTIRRAITQSSIKNGNGGYSFVPTYGQHMSVFYGLAKAAGADMASISGETVGVYPEAQKAAIQNMLGITDLISTEESSTATAVHAINSTFMMGGKLHRATTAIAIGDAVEVGTNCEVVKADEVFVKKTDKATSTTPGLVRFATNAAYGIWYKNAPEDDVLRIACAGENEIKAGTSSYMPIVPAGQHKSIFYGLSKLAGVDLANETVTIGSYPETSKTAIKTMLGIQEGLEVVTLI